MDKADLKHILSKFHPSETLMLSAASLVLGLATGAGVWLFKRLIDVVHWATFGKIVAWLTSLGGWVVILAPVAGGLLVGLIVHYLVGEERHHGVAGIMEAAALAGGRLRYKRLPAKALVSAISIGSGASLGPEDPSVQIGANLGSMVGQIWRLSDERTRTLLAAGSAAAIAAAFNAPIAGVFFALEIIMGEVVGSGLGIVVIASVASSVVTQALSGAQPAFTVPSFAFVSAWEYPLYLVLGLLAGPAAALYVQLLYAIQDLFRNIHLPLWIKPALAGLIVGIVGIFLPQLFGVGYNTIEQILAGQLTSISLLLALTIGKMVLTSISIAGGFKGGVFAPALFIGATLGAAYGMAIGRLFPNLGVAPQAFAMVGMAAVLAGSVHAPLTAILLLFEMTDNYHIILPLMFAVAVSLLLSQWLRHESVYTLGLVRKGIRLDRGRDVDVLQAIRVDEVMQREPHVLQESTSLAEVAELFQETHHHGLPVVNQMGELSGIFTLQDLDQALTSEKKINTVGEACTHQIIVAYADEPIGAALHRMSQRDLGRLPVVTRQEPRRLLGMLRRADIIRSYDLALTRRASLRHRAHQVRLDAISPEIVNVIELIVEPGSPCDSHSMKDIMWPRDCLIATLRRGGQVFIPHGDTILRAGDVLAVVAEGRAESEARRLCSRHENDS
jgi:CIC family chloride channel protein